MSKVSDTTTSHRTNIAVLAVIIGVAGLAAFIMMQYMSTTASSDSTVAAVNSNVNIANFSNTSADNGVLTAYGITVLTPTTYTTSGDMITYHFSDTNFLNIMPLSYKAMVLNETAITATEAITIGTRSAELLTLRSAKDGSTIKAVQLEHQDRLFDFRGNDEFLNNLSNYVQFN